MAKKTVQRTSPGDKRRLAMMDAAWKLFIQKGYVDVSLDGSFRRPDSE